MHPHLWSFDYKAASVEFVTLLAGWELPDALAHESRVELDSSARVVILRL